MSNENHEPTFQGPIEAGETSTLPAHPQPGSSVCKDHFIIEGLNIDQKDIVNIVLPKYILNHLNPSVGYTEKGFLLFTFKGNHKNGVYREILKGVKEGLADIKIRYLDPENNETISTWTFFEPLVHAVDFGYAAQERSEPAEFSVEVDYNKFDIDGFSI